ncbi:MAG: ABC transporter ATP-binding protein [Actinobacteria bacterium]|nr:ABC transporter ATP-binding protein [Actinomycetota bacterium]
MARQGRAHAKEARGTEQDHRGLVIREPMLAVRHLDFSYGQVQVLFDVDLDVNKGEVLALLGTNGAGKSTLLRAISGLGEPDTGVVRFGGKTVTYAEPHDRVRLGIVQVPGGDAVFRMLSVRDNLLAGAYTFIWDRDRVAERVDEVLGLFPVLAERLDQRAGTLSGGEQQMLGLAMGLMLDPKLLMIDELSLGLAPVIVQQLLEIVERLKDGGLTMVIVEQSLNVALALADRAVFMERGQVRFEGQAADLLDREDLVRAVFLGSEGG